jgi:hypothetical protein
MMPERGGELTCCLRHAWTADTITRRRQYKAAVFPPRLSPTPMTAPARSSDVPADMADAPGVATGTATDVSPHILVVAGAGGERRFSLRTDAVAWRGGPVDPTSVRVGDQVVVRVLPGRRDVADRIWVGIGRVTGTIVERHDDSLLVSEGATKRPQVVLVDPRTASRIQVRFPRLEPGHLIDVIGLRRGSVLEALLPATSQPAYRADRIPRLPPVPGLTHGGLSGSATWHETAAQGFAAGVGYPAIDPSSGCAEVAAGAGRGCASMPYLAIGSTLVVRNQCTGRSQLLPVTSCAAVAAMFCDRCLTCGTSPRSRIAELTVASFVALGGELERACFNATIAIGS